MRLFLKFLKPYQTTVLALMLMAFGFSVQAQKDMDKTYIKTTVKGTTYEVIGWEKEVVYNPYTFTWFTWEEPIVEKKTVERKKMIPVSEFTRPPVFTGNGDCLTVEDKFACSNNELQNYIAEMAVDYPDAAEELGQEGLEYVTFTLDENGEFEGNLKVVSKNDPCKGCEEAAADIVASMEDKWFPAIKDGKTVKTQLTIPVRFKLLDN